MNDKISISKNLAENLLDNTMELISQIQDFRKYPRYNNRCLVYEKDIAELKEALQKQYCPTCGAEVEIISDKKEGTSYYEPKGKGKIQ